MFRITCVLTILLAYSSIAFAQKVGDTVIVIRQCDIKSGNVVSDTVTAGMEFTVQKVNGKWLWVSRGHAGWIDSANTIPLEKAVAYFTDELRNNPTADAYASRGNVWRQKKEYDIAIADYSEAIRLNPTADWIYNNRGNCWLDKREWEKAIADFNESLRLKNDGSGETAITYNNRGLAWAKKKEYDKAIEDLSEAIRISPDYESPYGIRSVIYTIRGQYKEAMDDINVSIRLDKANAATYTRRATIWRKQGEYDKAIDDLSIAIQLNPKSDNAYNKSAWLRATCPDAKYRDGTKAVKNATTACELTEWKNYTYIGTLAAAYAENGDFDKAVEWQEKASKMYNDEEKKKWGMLLDLYKSGKPYRDEEKPSTPTTPD